MNETLTDPPWLQHLGELATLKNAIACYFHEDTGEDFASDEAIWDRILKDHAPQDLRLLGAQLDELLSRSDDTLLLFWETYSGYYCFDTGATVREYLSSKRVLFPSLR